MIAPIRIERGEQAGFRVIVVAGQIDVATAPQLRQTLVEVQHGGVHDVALDLDGVEFLDSIGLGVIVGGLKRAASHDRRLVVVCSRTRLLRLFESTRLDQIMPVVASLDDLEG